MLKLLRKILPRRKPPSPEPVEDLTSPASWKEEDSAALRSFLRSDTGIKYGVLLRQLTVRSALAAIHTDQGRIAWECGRAAGIQQAATEVDALANWQAEPEAPSGPTDDLNWLHGRDEQ